MKKKTSIQFLVSLLIVAALSGCIRKCDDCNTGKTPFPSLEPEIVETLQP